MKERGDGLNLDRNQSILLILGIFLISGLSFSLGFLVNSGGGDEKTLPNPGVERGGTRYAGTVEPNMGGALESGPIHSNDLSPDKKAEQVKEYTFFKSLSELPSKSSKGKPVKKTATLIKESVAVPKNKFEVKREIKKKIEPVKEPVEAALHRMFTVQVSSFKIREDAFALKDRLERGGYNSYIMIFNKDDAKWFRVRVGKFKTQDQAGAIMEKIKTREKLGAYIARYTR